MHCLAEPIHGDLGARDEVHAVRFCRCCCRLDAVHVVVVGERQRADPGGDRLGDDHLGII